MMDISKLKLVLVLTVAYVVFRAAGMFLHDSF